MMVGQRRKEGPKSLFFQFFRTSLLSLSLLVLLQLAMVSVSVSVTLEEQEEEGWEVEEEDISVHHHSPPAQCRGDEFRDGSWVLDTSRTKKEYMCCDPQEYETDPLSCPAAHKAIHFVHDNELIGNQVDPNSTHVDDRYCSCDHMSNSSHTITDREKYTWVPSNCSLVAWNATAFCEVLGNRSIFMIGDSLMLMLYTSLKKFLTRDGAVCASQVSHGQTTHMLYSLPIKQYSHRNLENYLKVFEADIYLLNAGAWLEDQGDAYSVYFQSSNFIKKYLETHSNKTFTWISMSEGHWGCETATKPLAPNETWVVPDSAPSFDGNTENAYNWNRLPEFNHISYDIWKMNNWSYIDMAPIFRMRPDAHRVHVDGYFESRAVYDCLHFCLPGPTDIFPQVLLHKMLWNEL